MSARKLRTTLAIASIALLGLAWTVAPAVAKGLEVNGVVLSEASLTPGDVQIVQVTLRNTSDSPPACNWTCRTARTSASASRNKFP